MRQRAAFPQARPRPSIFAGVPSIPISFFAAPAKAPLTLGAGHAGAVVIAIRNDRCQDLVLSARPRPSDSGHEF